MKKIRIFLVLAVSAVIFLLVYSPHYFDPFPHYHHYPFPRHIDEWHHITEAIRLEKGQYPLGTIGYRVGFHIILMLLSKVTNLLSIYQFLPAIWAVVSGLVLFYVVYKKTGARFYTALAAMIFFASIKSNVNITGLWFFNSLTFSIPFIFLYVYFFTEGVEKENKKLLLISLAIMVMLLPIHSISVLFAIQFLLIYCLCNLRYIAKEWKFFSVFLVIPAVGLVFYKFMSNVPWQGLLADITTSIQFKKGWGILELKNSPFELYSLAGYILAFAGLIFIFTNKKVTKKYLAYALWPITVFIAIVTFRITGISYLCPYQRNLYYFAIGLPILSAFGVDYLFEKRTPAIKTVFFPILIISIFIGYFDIPKQLELYKVIDGNDYKAIKFLSGITEKSTVMAMPGVSEAIYPVSGHKPVATYAFYGIRADAERFFYPKTSFEEREQLLKKHGVKYVLSKTKFNYGWKTIYDDGYYIYEVAEK